MTWPFALHPSYQRTLDSGFKYHHTNTNQEDHPHDEAQDHPHDAGVDRAAVAVGRRGSDVRHRPARLAEQAWAPVTAPEHPGAPLTDRGDPAPPNAAPTIAAPAGLSDQLGGPPFRRNKPMNATRAPEPVAASCWTDYSYVLEGSDVFVHAELSDVDEVSLVIRDDDVDEVAVVHLGRVHAIALAGQLAAAGVADQRTLPSGHGPTGPLT